MPPGPLLVMLPAPVTAPLMMVLNCPAPVVTIRACPLVSTADCTFSWPLFALHVCAAPRVRLEKLIVWTLAALFVIPPGTVKRRVAGDHKGPGGSVEGDGVRSERWKVVIGI